MMLAINPVQSSHVFYSTAITMVMYQSTKLVAQTRQVMFGFLSFRPGFIRHIFTYIQIQIHTESWKNGHGKLAVFCYDEVSMFKEYGFNKADPDPKGHIMCLSLTSVKTRGF